MSGDEHSTTQTDNSQTGQTSQTSLQEGAVVLQLPELGSAQDTQGEAEALEGPADEHDARRVAYQILAMARACSARCEDVVDEAGVRRAERNPEQLMQVARIFAARLRPSQIDHPRLSDLRVGTLEDTVEALRAGALSDPALAWKALCGLGGHMYSRYGMGIEGMLMPRR